MDKKYEIETEEVEATTEEPKIVEEFHIEELAIDGICGVY